MKCLKFPKLGEFKSLPRFEEDDDEMPIEYAVTLFTVFDDIYCRITFNEDGNNGFYLDLMSDGYCDKYGGSKYYESTKEGYCTLMFDANELYNEILDNILCSNDKGLVISEKY